jgi:hypothetical protein
MPWHRDRRATPSTWQNRPALQGLPQECVEQQNCALVVAHLSFGEHHHDEPPFAVADGMKR